MPTRQMRSESVAFFEKRRAVDRRADAWAHGYGGGVDQEASYRTNQTRTTERAGSVTRRSVGVQWV